VLISMDLESATPTSPWGKGEIDAVGATSSAVDVEEPVANPDSEEGGPVGARLGDDLRSRHTKRTFLNTKSQNYQERTYSCH
jgi:hypothetical protein